MFDLSLKIDMDKTKNQAVAGEQTEFSSDPISMRMQTGRSWLNWHKDDRVGIVDPIAMIYRLKRVNFYRLILVRSRSNQAVGYR